MGEFMRKLATIRKVDEILPIEGADAIELSVFGGWQVVVKKAQEIKPGMLVVYCEIDSVFPEQQQYEFLRQDKFRLRTKKFRGALSQGIVFKIDEVLTVGNYAEGEDVTGILGITLYEPPIPAAISGDVAGAYPGTVPKTDEERIQNLDIETFSGISFFVTEKLDGTSCSFIFDEFGLHVCGRNWEFCEAPDQTFWKLARHYDIEEKLRDYHARTGSYLALQGEVVGYGRSAIVFADSSKLLVRKIMTLSVSASRYLTRRNLSGYFLAVAGTVSLIVWSQMRPVFLSTGCEYMRSNLKVDFALVTKKARLLVIR
jgi:RNA ligase (TIGR02306 family)